MIPFRDYKNLYISFVKLRRIIGFIAILLPLILVMGSVIVSDCEHIQNSISHYYFTSMGVVFVAALSGISVLLITYRGYDRNDNITSSLAAFFLMGLVLFPTHQNHDLTCAKVFLKENSLRVGIHYTSAGLFFLTVSYMIYFQFTKVNTIITSQKLVRNRIFRICARIIVCSMLLVGIILSIPFLTHLLKPFKPVFWLEWIALIAFGFAWLVKGKMFFNDKRPKIYISSNLLDK
ncbi:MAG: hypothetical protein E6Q95_02865 [Chitinophagaceae bacterium]|nr:MAG: hypothetical protein E6Q95_02865 [Chitinophagaceae bacterium]